MRVLVVAGPMHGHVNTLVPIALAAQRAGHDVAFATGPELVAQVGEQGLATWSVETPGLAKPGPGSDFLAYFLAAAEIRSRELVPRAREWRADLVIHEETELAGAAAAQAAGARHVVHGLSVMPPLRLWEVMASALERLFATWAPGTSADAVRDATYVDICPAALEPPWERVWANAVPLRPSLSPTPPDAVLPAELDALPRARTAHVTLGTVFHGSADVLATAVEGVRGADVNAVVTTGPGTDPRVVDSDDPGVFAADYLPHALLLPRCDLVVSQGGAGIMYGALALGIPQVALPQGGDQHMLAEALVRSGAGLALDGDEVTVEAVRDAASLVLSATRFRSAAAEVATEIAARPGPDEVFAQLAAA
jgi:UDP:flavonoid glycosyltransferase YjiC (YdhE family)